MSQTTPQAAYRGLVASMLLNPSVIGVVDQGVTVDDVVLACIEAARSDTTFDADANAKLFSLVIDMHQAGQSVLDVRLVVDHLRTSGILAMVGGAAAFSQSYLWPQATENVKHYIDAVRQIAVAARIRKLGTRFAIKTESEFDNETLTRWLRCEVDSLQSQVSSGSHTSNLHEVCERLCEEISKSHESGEHPSIPTGIEFLDATYGGFFPSCLYVVAARPGGGKSSLSQQIGEHIAYENEGTLFISLEMSRLEVAARYLSRRTGINNKFIRNHILEPEDIDQIRTATEAAKDIPFWISEPTGRHATMESICAEARVHHTTHGLTALVIDYLQIIEPSHAKQVDYDKVTQATRSFKQLARELEIPVILLSQLSRKGEADGKQTEAREPRLSDLRASGSIEQDADGVIFAHQLDGRLCRLIVAKMRGGEQSREELEFDGPTCTFHPAPASAMGNYASEFEEWNG